MASPERRLLVTLLAVTAMSGCGPTNDEPSQEEWMNEVFLLANELQEARQRADRRLRAAVTTGDEDRAAAAFSDYAEDLAEFKSRLAEVEPPEACADVQQSMEDFASGVQELSTQLADPVLLRSRAQFAAAIRQMKPEVRAFVKTIEPIATSGHC